MALRVLLIVGLLVFLSLVYIGLAFVMALMPGKIVSTVTPADFGMSYERVTLDTEDGLQLTGWFIPNPVSTAVIMVGHGYPYDKGNIFPSTRFLAGHFNLFYFDFRYFGESQGKFTTFGLDERKDIAAAMTYLKQRPGIDAGRIGQFGFSLSAAAFIQAHHSDVQVMVLDAPFLSLDAMIRDHYRYLIGPLKLPFVVVSKVYGRIFLKRNVDQASAFREIDGLICPVLFIHGEKDSQIPAWHSKKLYEACSAKEKDYWLVQDADHGETLVRDKAVYQQRVSDFFKKYLDVEAK
ncbi:prolyl oligopeptidase family serine peptidase [bacterium]|nr:prolyl oligopeptidase family serine peptidase [bacterium]